MLRREICPRATMLSHKVSFDLRELLTIAKYGSAAGRLMWQLIKPFRPEVLIGPGFGAAPLLYAISMAALEDNVELSVLMVRDQRKQHNRKRWVEGAHYPAHTRAVMIDDFLGRGTAIDLVDQALAEDNRVLDICAVALFLDLWMPASSRQLSVSRFPVISLFKRHDIGLSRDCHDAAPPTMRGAAPAFIDQPLWWRFDLNKHDHPMKCAPVIADNAVFVADDDSRIWRIDGTSGEAVWRYESLVRHYKGIVQQLQYADDSLVFGSYGGPVTRLDARTGKIIWRWKPDSHVHATPALDLDNGRFFINTEQQLHGLPIGHLYAMDWHSGKVLWRFHHAYWPPCSPIYSAAHNVVIAAANDKSLVCVNADNGELLWSARTDGLVRGRAAISGNTVLVATEKGFLHSYDIHSGMQLHRCRYGAGLHHQFLHADERFVYALDSSAHLFVFDIEQLRLRWLSKLRSAGVWTPIPLHHYLVILSREGHLAVMDKQRQIKLWEGKVGGIYRQPPAIGMIDGKPMLVTASNRSGLKAFRIHPFYDQPDS
ncbi:hypothetical protein RB25_11550 [Herbaspirillum rubrisubalbicans]|nr:hypothetical protein RB25_11550 [Herbaspirillum rubrisubalbicans]